MRASYNRNEPFFLGLSQGQTEVFLDVMGGLDVGKAIENQEKAGQLRSCKQQRLPISGTWDNKQQWEDLGFVFTDEKDHLFVSVIFPEGWSLKPTDHSMYSDLIDDKNRKRGAMFYKAAFYDEKANVYLTRRYSVKKNYDDPDPDNILIDVIDKATNTVIQSFKKNMAECAGQSKYAVQDALEAEARELLDRDYPDWGNSSAYWD